MTDKQSLYQLLGLNDKASPEDIQAAYNALRGALEAEPESEEKHNRIAILTNARDLLLDRRKRAGYDRRQHDRRHDDPPAKERSGRGPIVILGFLVGLAVAWYAGRQSAPTPLPPPAPVAAKLPPAPTAVATLPAPAAADQDLDIREPAAPLPTAATAPSGPTAAIQPSREADVPRPIDALQSSARGGIATSTYAILGGGGQGTGVAISSDKLLTNCHVIAPNVHKGPLLAIHAVTGKRTVITHAAFLVKEDACVAYAPGLNASPIQFGSTRRLTKDATIYNLGFAQGRLTYSGGSFIGMTNRSGQDFMVSTNYCDFGVSGGPLVDGAGFLVGLTSGGTRDKKYCASLTVETARQVLDQTLIAIDGFPTDYLSNLQRRW